MNQKIADMAQEMEDQRSNHRAQLAAKDDEIKRLLDELANQVRLNPELREILRSLLLICLGKYELERCKENLNISIIHYM